MDDCLNIDSDARPGEARCGAAGPGMALRGEARQGKQYSEPLIELVLIEEGLEDEGEGGGGESQCSTITLSYKGDENGKVIYPDYSESTAKWFKTHNVRQVCRRQQDGVAARAKTLPARGQYNRPPCNQCNFINDRTEHGKRTQKIPRSPAV